MSIKELPDLRALYEENQFDSVSYVRVPQSQDGGFVVPAITQDYNSWRAGYLYAAGRIANDNKSLSDIKVALAQAKVQLSFAKSCGAVAVLDPRALDDTLKAVDAAIHRLQQS